MNAIEPTEPPTTQPPAQNQKRGAKKGRPNKSKGAGSKSGSFVPASGPLTAKEACALLGCHYQTFLYRERRGDITPYLRVKNFKFYYREDVLRLARQKPVKNKPHYTKRAKNTGGANEIVISNQPEPAVIVRTEPEQPVSLWSKIKNLFSAFAAK